MTVGATDTDRRLRRARRVALASLVASVGSALLLPGIGLTREPDPLRLALGATGLVAFAVAQAAVLHAAVTPWLGQRRRHRLHAAFAVVAVATVPLAGPVAAGAWPTWAWLGASLVGMTPLLLRPRPALAVAAAVVAVAVAVAGWTGGSAAAAVVIAGGVGAGAAAVNGVQVWFWDLLVAARQGQQAHARLAAAEERLRFARDVHDLLGHDLTVIALKAELAARLASVDAGRAGREAAEVQRLAGTALHRVREAVHGYRAVDLGEQLAAVTEVLRSCGVRCDVDAAAGELPAEAAAELAAVLREAATNVLRHSRANWCRIGIVREDDAVTMTVSNDGVGDAREPDGHSHGLRGLAERVAAAGGGLRVRCESGVFTLAVTVPVPR
ncbi:histidine kinase [Micromonospora sp. KC213]|uniref:sensor histidine kinase n=1 Tax=Micromonospora sp. KC213 TaxID=2530378 RepID=UPI0010474FD2|nr:histidine kinase [Micromonospora sp. KC213]TDC43425.1 histidine kinase [Micromonospora sp. KC213]